MNRLERILLATTLALASTTVYYARELHAQRARSELPQLSLATGNNSQSALRQPSHKSGSVAAEGEGQAQVPEPDPGQLAVARLRLERWHDPQVQAEEARKAEQSLRQFLGKGMELMPGTVMPGMELPEAEIEQIIGPLTQQALRDQERRLQCASEASCDVAALEAAQERDGELQLINLLGAERVERYKARVEAWQATEPRP